MESIRLTDPTLPALPSRYQSGRHGRLPEYPPSPVTNLPRYTLNSCAEFARAFGLPTIDGRYVSESERIFSEIHEQSDKTPAEIRMTARLGGGTFGTVHYGTLGGSEPVAVKVVPLPPRTCNTPRVIQLTREMLVPGLTPHRNLVRMHAAFVQGGVNYLITEHCDGGCLTDTFDYCVAHHWVVRMTDAMSIFLQLARAIRHLHHRHIIHRDIKPDNILFTSRNPAPPRSDGRPGPPRRPIISEPLSNFRVKLCDFGLVRRCDGVTGLSARRPGMTVSAGTKLWMAPEATRQDGQYGLAADIFAWGVCALQLLSRQPPKLFRRPAEPIREGYAAYLLPSNTPPAFAQLVLAALDPNPAQRPTADELVGRLKAALIDAGAVIVQSTATAAKPLQPVSSPRAAASPAAADVE